MPFSNETGLLDAIFKAFPSARIIGTSESIPYRSETLTVGNPKLAKRTNQRQADSRACKRNVVDHRQLFLFDENKGGGI
jgi:hypothetical protein